MYGMYRIFLCYFPKSVVQKFVIVRKNTEQNGKHEYCVCKVKMPLS